MKRFLYVGIGYVASILLMVGGLALVKADGQSKTGWKSEFRDSTKAVSLERHSVPKDTIVVSLDTTDVVRAMAVHAKVLEKQEGVWVTVKDVDCQIRVVVGHGWMAINSQAFQVFRTDHVLQDTTTADSTRLTTLACYDGDNVKCLLIMGTTVQDPLLAMVRVQYNNVAFVYQLLFGKQ